MKLPLRSAVLSGSLSFLCALATTSCVQASAPASKEPATVTSGVRKAGVDAADGPLGSPQTTNEPFELQANDEKLAVFFQGGAPLCRGRVTGEAAGTYVVNFQRKTVRLAGVDACGGMIRRRDASAERARVPPSARRGYEDSERARVARRTWRDRAGASCGQHYPSRQPRRAPREWNPRWARGPRPADSRVFRFDPSLKSKAGGNGSRLSAPSAERAR